MSNKARTVGRERRHRRVRKNLRGSADRPRLNVFKSNRYIYAQLVDDDAGRTLAAASSLETALRSTRLSVTTAGEVGKSIAERARAAGIHQVVFDRGGYRFHGRVKALAEAARAEGLEF